MTPREAKAAGLVFYDGKACPHCTNTKRYASTGQCVMCRRRGKTTLAAISAVKKQDQILRDAATKLGHLRYQGRDCLHAHGGLRYSTTGSCVACRRMVEVAINERKKAERVAQKERRKAPPIARPNPTPDMNGWVSCIKPPTMAQLMAGRAR